MNKLFSNARGFTLIELLFVVAIISILAAIVMAAVSGSGATARDARRVADLKSLQAAINLFIQDTGAPPANNGWWAQLNNSCAGWQPGPRSQLIPGYFSSVLPEDPQTTNTTALTQCVTTAGGIWYWYGRGKSLSGSSLVATDAGKYIVCATLEKSSTSGYQVIPNPWGTTPALNYCLGN